MESSLKYFFSYARADGDYVLRVAQDLRYAGVSVWIDQLDIAGGDRWDQAVEDALRSCLGMIAFISPNAVASNTVMDEISYALEEHKFLVPIILKPCEIPFRLRRVQWIDFTTDYDAGLGRLLVALGADRIAVGEKSSKDSCLAITPDVTVRGVAAANTEIPTRPPQKAVARKEGDLSSWRSGVIMLEDIFSGNERPQALQMVTAVCDTLASKRWSADRLAIVQFAASEIIENAFVFGVENDVGTVTVLAILSSRRCELRVTDGGPGFDLQKHTVTNSDETSHGLAQVFAMVDEMVQTDPRTIVLQINSYHTRLKLVKQDDIARIAVFSWEGRADHDTTKHHVFNAQCNSVMELVRAGTKVAFDLSHLEYISSVGLRYLMLLAKAARPARIVLVSPHPGVQEIFLISRFHLVCPIVPTMTEAMHLLL